MHDLLAIQQLACRYAHTVDHRKYAEFDRVFTPDGLLQLPKTPPCEGLDAIRAAVRHIEQYKRTLHHINNVMADVSGDSATSEVYCLAEHIYDGQDGREWKMDWGIRYEDELRRTAAGWRIAKRTLSLIWTQDAPLSPSAFM